MISGVELGAAGATWYGDQGLCMVARAYGFPRAGWEDWMGLTENQQRVLIELAYATRDGAWVRPLDLGGHSHNGVSAVLAALVRRGLAGKRSRHGPNLRGPRGSYVYTATQAGRDAVDSSAVD